MCAAPASQCGRGGAALERSPILCLGVGAGRGRGAAGGGWAGEVFVVLEGVWFGCSWLQLAAVCWW